jgi:putative peptidoglycan lipid II flippase
VAALRSVLFLALPATLGLIVLGGPVVSLLYERGVWTAEDTAGTAWALAFFAVGIAGHASLEVLSRAFYALADSRTPVFVGVLSLISNIALSIIFIQFIGDPSSLARGPFAGLALANSLTTLAEALVLWGLLRRRIGDLNDRYFLDGLLRTGAATGVMTVVIVGFAWLANGRIGPGLIGIIGALLGAAVFFGSSLALKMDETRMVLGVVARRFKR